MFLEWIHAHKFALGLIADVLTFAGAAALARDAFRRMADLRRARKDAEFRRAYSTLHLSDEELKAASVSVRWAFAGFGLMCLGFLCQLALRFCE
jgi:hypothetical protein